MLPQSCAIPPPREWPVSANAKPSWWIPWQWEWKPLKTNGNHRFFYICPMRYGEKPMKKTLFCFRLEAQQSIWLVFNPWQSKYTNWAPGIGKVGPTRASNAQKHREREGETHTHIYIYDGLPKCLFLVWWINRNSLRAASCLLLKTMTYLNSLESGTLHFIFHDWSRS